MTQFNRYYNVKTSRDQLSTLFVAKPLAMTKSVLAGSKFHTGKILQDNNFFPNVTRVLWYVQFISVTSGAIATELKVIRRR